MAQQRPLQGARRRAQGVARRDQEGLPQARAPVPPRQEPGRHEGRGALQGDLRGARRPRRRRQAQGVRPRAANPFSRGGPRRRRPAGFDASGFGDILSDLFGAGDGGGAPAAPARAPRPRAERGRDLEAEVSIGFEQAVDGAQVPISVPTSSAAAPAAGRAPSPAPRRRSARAARAAASSPRARACSRSPSRARSCGGAGTIIEDPCPTCQGAGRSAPSSATASTSPRASREGSRDPAGRQGRAGRNGGPPGDLFVITHVPDSPVFKRKGDNVEVEVPLTIPEALRGAEIEVPTLDGRKTLRVPAGHAARAPCSACAARAPSASARPAAATSTTASSSTCPTSLTDEQRGGRRRAREGA